MIDYPICICDALRSIEADLNRSFTKKKVTSGLIRRMKKAADFLAQGYTGADGEQVFDLVVDYDCVTSTAVIEPFWHGTPTRITDFDLLQKVWLDV